MADVTRVPAPLLGARGVTRVVLLVLVWMQSAVLCCKFSPYQPNRVVGGTYSGQIVIWDNRAKRTPVQRSKLSTVRPCVAATA